MAAEPQGAQLRPRPELLAMLDQLVADGMAVTDPATVNLPWLSAMSEAAEVLRAAHKADADPAVAGELSVAIIGEAIVIRLPLSVIPDAVEGWWATGRGDHWRVTDAGAFAPEVVRALEDEAEDGSTPVHLLFDAAFERAIESGAEGVVEELDDDKTGDDDETDQASNPDAE